jgi:hypothetical protein
MPGNIGPQNLALLLGQVRADFQASVGKDSTATDIVLYGLDLGTVDLAGGYVLLDAGALGADSVKTLASISSNTATTLTVPTLGTSPVTGANLWVYSENTINVVAAENVAQWGGATVKAANSNGVVLFTVADPSGVGTANVNEATGGTLADYVNAVDANALTYGWDATNSNWRPQPSQVSTALYDGQASVTTTAAALPSQVISEVVLTADPTNTSGEYVYVGNATSQHTPLAPGQSITLSISNLDLVYAFASSGTLKLDYLARS